MPPISVEPLNVIHEFSPLSHAARHPGFLDKFFYYSSYYHAIPVILLIVLVPFAGLLHHLIACYSLDHPTCR